jgi:hypothetical protein
MEKIAGRLEAHLSGQKSMNFATQAIPSEADLLPLVQEAIISLRSQ